MKNDVKIKATLKSEEETILLGQKIAQSLHSPCVVSLVGDLGAGKTTFAKGFAKGLEINENITSPTYTLMNEYKGKTNLYHFDLYRLESLEDAYSLGFEEYFDLTKLKGISLVEWASNCEGILPMSHFEINITKSGENERIIEIIPRGVV